MAFKFNPFTGILDITGTSGGGGSAPGGANGSIQFNDTGSFNGFGNWDGSNFTVGGDVTAINFFGTATKANYLYDTAGTPLISADGVNRLLINSTGITTVDYGAGTGLTDGGGFSSVEWGSRILRASDGMTGIIDWSNSTSSANYYFSGGKLIGDGSGLSGVITPPGGSNGNLQYNNAGNFAGDASLNTDGSGNLTATSFASASFIVPNSGGGNIGTLDTTASATFTTNSINLVTAAGPSLLISTLGAIGAMKGTMVLDGGRFITSNTGTDSSNLAIEFEYGSATGFYSSAYGHVTGVAVGIPVFDAISTGISFININDSAGSPLTSIDSNNRILYAADGTTKVLDWHGDTTNVNSAIYWFDSAHGYRLTGPAQGLNGFTTGSVLFAGSSGTISEDVSNFGWDAANNRLSLATTISSSTLNVGGNILLTATTPTTTRIVSSGNALTNTDTGSRLNVTAGTGFSDPAGGTDGGLLALTSGSGGNFTGTSANGAAGAGGGVTHQTGNGGQASTSNTGTNTAGNGGAIQILSGVGGNVGNSSTGNIAGNGGSFTFSAGRGSNLSNGLAAEVAGTGGAFTLQSGAGGTNNTTAGFAGPGGATTINGGAGGASTGSAGSTGGVGGVNLFAGGAGGNATTSSSGTNTAGAGGATTVRGGTGGTGTNSSTVNVGGAGGSLSLTGGTGGASNAGSGTRQGGAGGTVDIAGGAGANSNGAGGSVYLVGGASNGTGATANVYLGLSLGGTSRGTVIVGTSTITGGRVQIRSTTEQLRIEYDSSNYCTNTVSSTGSITYALTGSSPVFNFTNRLTSTLITEQMRAAYDASNYFSTTVSSTGGVTLDAVGSGAGFTFSDQITGSAGYIGSDLTASQLVLTNGSKKLVSSTVLAAGIASITNVSLTNQAADITATNIATVAGLYLVSYSLQDTTADITAGAVVLTLSYTDGGGATTATATQVLTGTGRQTGSVYIQLASGNITYATTHTGLFGTSKYALYLTTERYS